MKRIRPFLPLLSWPLLAPPGSAQAVLYTHDGAHAVDRFGSSVAILPDIDGDSVEDYAVGAPFDDPDQNGTKPGSVRIYSGKHGTLLRTLVGEGSDSEFGASLAAIPDASGDGRADLLIGAPSRSVSSLDQGAAYAFSPSTGVQIGWILGESMHEHLGAAVANVGDVNDNGTDDWAIGSPNADVNLVNNGRVRVFDGFSLSLIEDHASPHSGALYGSSISRAGDVNLDGRADYLVGQPGVASGNTSSIGGALLMLGDIGAWTTKQGSEAYEQFGWAVATLGDVDGDWKPEFAISSPHFDGNGTSRGRVVVYDGATAGELWQVEGLSDDWKLGWSMTPVGDWDGDGVNDLAIGAPGYLMVSIGRLGAVRIHSGDDGALIATLIGSEDASAYGRAIASGRDLNDDGRQEILVGAPDEDAHGYDSGRVRMHLADVMRPARYGTAKTNSAGCVPKIGYAGAPSRTIGDNFHVTASDILPDKSGMLFFGFGQVATPFHGGTLLVGQPLVRTGVQSSGGGGSSCDGAFDFHFSSSLMQSYSLPAGQLVFAQYWYRDPGFALPDNIGLTNALKFEIAN